MKSPDVSLVAARRRSLHVTSWLGVCGGGCLVVMALAVSMNVSGMDRALADSEHPRSMVLPEGSSGIAARVAAEADIQEAPAVLFADDFESYELITDLRDRWDTVHHVAQMSLVADPKLCRSGGRALELTLPRQKAEFSHAIGKSLAVTRDHLFLRYYAKFDPPFDIVGSSHNGCTVSGRYFENGRATPGVPADGRNKFLAALEHWRGDAATVSPGHLNVYVYHPEQRSQWGDHFFPTGKVLPNSSLRFDFGPQFKQRDDVLPTLGQWHCYEFMVALNTPGRRDGRIAFWLDGRLAGDFRNLRLRDTTELGIDRFGLNLHAGSNPRGPARQWVDAVVAATDYIGPINEGVKAR